jgi:4-hydroxybenzoate polyprenyltransferase
MKARPLVIDMDRALFKTDPAVESFLSLFASRPWHAIRLALGAFRNTATFSKRVTDAARLEMSLLPLDPSVVDVIATAREQGREIYTVSAVPGRDAAPFAGHLGEFAGGVEAGPGNELSGEARAEALVARFGERGYDYVGSQHSDLPAWQRSHGAIIAGGSARLRRQLLNQGGKPIFLDRPRLRMNDLVRALRPHQWLKNLLVLVPAAAGHTLLGSLPQAALAFVAFSLCASSVYVTNDLLDLTGDRTHPRKRQRPFASGALHASHGVGLAFVLLAAALVATWFLPVGFGLALGVYFALTIAYSVTLKRKAIIDVIALACLYGMRVLAGGYATGTVVSPWLAALAAFLFLSLALVKRCAELVDRKQAGLGDPVGRGYRLDDLPVLETMAVTAGYNSALVLALYISTIADPALYSRPQFLWLLCMVLLAWLSRIFLLTHRGLMNDDPVIFAVRDRWSLVMGSVCVLVVMASI